MRIDIHGHIGVFGDREYSPRSLESHRRTAAIDLVLISNIAAISANIGGKDEHEADANAACLDACRRRSGFLPLYWVRPGGYDTSPFALAGALEMEPFAGAVVAPDWNDFRIDCPYMHTVTAILGRAGLPLLVHVGTCEGASPPAIYAMARRHPGVSVVLLGGLAPECAADTVEIVRRASREGDARLYVDTSGGEPGQVVSSATRLSPAWVVFGSDAGAESREHVSRVQKLVELLRDELHPGVFDLVMGGTAAEIFRIESRLAMLNETRRGRPVSPIQPA